jgi:hypothetical protein
MYDDRDAYIAAAKNLGRLLADYAYSLVDPYGVEVTSLPL